MRIIALTFLLIMALAGPASSDIIHFKDGGQVEGLITDETEHELIIDIGIGTMSVRKDDIDHIEEATTEELEQLKSQKLAHDIERGEWSPEGYEDVRIFYLRAKDSKAALTDRRRKSQSLKEEIQQKENTLSGLLSVLDKKGQDLKKKSIKDNIGKYNEVVADINTINADLTRINNEIKSLYAIEKTLNSELSQLVGNYRKSFNLFSDAWKAKHKQISEHT